MCSCSMPYRPVTVGIRDLVCISDLAARRQHGALAPPGEVPGLGEAVHRRGAVEVPAVRGSASAALARRAGRVALSRRDGSGRARKAAGGVWAVKPPRISGHFLHCSYSVPDGDSEIRCYLVSMLVFIDESGDPGFKIERGSSPIFVISMVIFDHSSVARQCESAIEHMRRKLRVNPEFKFNRCHANVRDAFFDGTAPFRFRARSIIVRKELIYSCHLKGKKETFYKFFIRNMMQHDGGALRDAKVVIDGSGDKAFKGQFKAHLRRHLDISCVKEVELRDSKKDSLVQLADMVAGAVARSYKPDRANSDRWLSMLYRQGKIENIWEFK